MSAEVCPGREGTAASHCWHTGGLQQLSLPPSDLNICCHCGANRWVRATAWKDIGSHGPFATPGERTTAEQEPR